ncbi:MULTISPECIES: NTP transferase domain-containing protein [unclassified Arthrobacter]|uniref:molybdenum cofactor guanylyltransferase n=1 Tax=unclassified Arthrobacter TaxID=235627 RepID=UPI0033995113
MDADPLSFDAVILAGGRSARLGGVPKQSLTYDGDTLLRRSVAAAGGARAIAVVGPGPGNMPAGILSCREEPPFGGPAAAIAAGLAAVQDLSVVGGAAAGDATGGCRPRLTLVLACDMPNVRHAVAALRKALEAGGPAVAADGVVAVSQDGRRQPLVGFYSTAALQRSVAELAAKGSLINGSVGALLASLDLQPVAVPAGSTADVDTWDDAAALGVAGPDPLSGSRSNAAADDLGGRA